MTAKAGADEKSAAKEEKAPLTKKATFINTPPVIEEEKESDALEKVVSTTPVQIVPSLSRMTTNSKFLGRSEKKR